MTAHLPSPWVHHSPSPWVHHSHTHDAHHVPALVVFHRRPWPPHPNYDLFAEASVLYDGVMRWER